MADTALRAEAQSATSHKESVAYGDHPYDITHMVFANGEHEKSFQPDLWVSSRFALQIEKQY